jgi:DNA-binding beta-propeller fold protein YncE
MSPILPALPTLFVAAACSAPAISTPAAPAAPAPAAPTASSSFSPPSPPSPTNATYRLFVTAESADLVCLVAFDAASGEARVERRIPVGYQPTEIEGPHGLCISPDGEHWFVTIAHGKPFGLLYKYSTATHELVGQCELGLFPATMQISEATGLLYCVNFDLHGKMEPSTVSVVDPDAMVEVARTTTGPMPHGSRISPDGRRHYSCGMMSDELFEIDTVTFEVTRTLHLSTSDDAAAPEHASHDMAGHEGHGQHHGHAPKAKPTWVFPHPSSDHVYVALNGAEQVVEVDTEAWAITRRFETAKGPYNVEVTPDGRRMAVTYKGAQLVGIWDLETGEELARIETTRRVPHGVVISSDSRFAFVSNEGIGGEMGTLDVIDLEKLERVATAEIGLQAGGIYFWRKN